MKNGNEQLKNIRTKRKLSKEKEYKEILRKENK
jgi:hypothetical protein